MWWLVGLLLCLLVGWGVVSAHRVLAPERRRITPPAPLPMFTTHPLTASDGQPFDAWLLEHPAPRARLLVCHGYYANRYQVLGLADGLRQQGYEILLFELRGHGSRLAPCTFGIKEADDALTVLRWAATRGTGSSLPIGVLGFSMGAAVMCQLAAREPAVRAVVVDSIYSRLFPVLRRAIWRRYHLPPIPWAWLTWWSVQLALQRRLAASDPAVLAPRLRQPLLAIQGGEDRHLVPLLGREFYQRWAGPKERWFEPQIAHVGMFATHPAEYQRRVADFFQRTVVSSYAAGRSAGGA